MEKTIVGLIANPASGKDIRRLVAHGTVFDNQEKISIVRRLIISLMSGGVDKIIFMPDYHGLIPKALSGLGSNYEFDGSVLRRKASSARELVLERAAIDISATQADTKEAAAFIASKGAGCLLVLGGDGTSRQAAKGARDIPILALSTGTNNVFPFMAEATSAGLVAAAVARGRVGPRAVYRAKRIVVEKNSEFVDSALVDAVVTRGRFIGSRAVWEIGDLVEGIFARGEAGDIGLASVIGKTRPLKPRDNFGAYVVFDSSRRDVIAPVAPGVIKAVGLSESGRLNPGDRRAVKTFPSVLALDGERELEISEKDQVSIGVDLEGPLVVDLPMAFQEAVAAGFHSDPELLSFLD